MTRYTIKIFIFCLIFYCFNFIQYNWQSKAFAYDNYNDYYSQSLDLLPFKWTKFPVTIYLGNVPHNYKSTIINAINYWKNYFPFEISDNQNSDIDIIWVNKLPTYEWTKASGTTSHTINNNDHKVLIKIRNQKFCKTELNEIILHELGHATGLGESANANDIMYPISRAKDGRINSWSIRTIGYFPLILPAGYDSAVVGKSFLTERDINTLSKIYQEPSNNYNVNNYTCKTQKPQQIYNNTTFSQQPYTTSNTNSHNLISNYIAVGNNYFYNGNYNQAIENYKKAIEIAPNNAVANKNIGSCYNNIGLTLKEKGLSAKAIEYFEKALLINPNNENAYVNLGSTYIDIGKYDLSIENSQKAININSNSESAYINLGVAYQKKGSLNKALELYRKALAINPNSMLAKQNYNNLNNFIKFKQ